MISPDAGQWSAASKLFQMSKESSKIKTDIFQIFQEVGLPDGVLNMVCGYGPKAGEAIVRHPDVKVLSFTGSTLVGRHIAQVAAPMMKRLSLELGGKNPALVFADANLEKAVPTLIRAAFLNQGEICLCTSRMYVHENIFDTFLIKFVEETKKLKIGEHIVIFF